MTCDETNDNNFALINNADGIDRAPLFFIKIALFFDVIYFLSCDYLFWV